MREIKNNTEKYLKDRYSVNLVQFNAPSTEAMHEQQKVSPHCDGYFIEITKGNIKDVTDKLNGFLKEEYLEWVEYYNRAVESYPSELEEFQKRKKEADLKIEKTDDEWEILELIEPKPLAPLKPRKEYFKCAIGDIVEYYT